LKFLRNEEFLSVLLFLDLEMTNGVSKLGQHCFEETRSQNSNISRRMQKEMPLMKGTDKAKREPKLSVTGYVCVTALMEAGG
jgi:hypothetical protein